MLTIVLSASLSCHSYDCVGTIAPSATAPSRRSRSLDAGKLDGPRLTEWSMQGGRRRQACLVRIRYRALEAALAAGDEVVPGRELGRGVRLRLSGDRRYGVTVTVTGSDSVVASGWWNGHVFAIGVVMVRAKCGRSGARDGRRRQCWPGRGGGCPPVRRQFVADERGRTPPWPYGVGVQVAPEPDRRVVRSAGYMEWRLPWTIGFGGSVGGLGRTGARGAYAVGRLALGVARVYGASALVRRAFGRPGFGGARRARGGTPAGRAGSILHRATSSSPSSPQRHTVSHRRDAGSSDAETGPATHPLPRCAYTRGRRCSSGRSRRPRRSSRRCRSRPCIRGRGGWRPLGRGRGCRSRCRG
jgi:hypothetical protein